MSGENPDEYEYDHRLIKRFDQEIFFTPASDIMMPYRDKKIRETIFDILPKTSKPIIVILGASHSAELSKGNMLRGHGFDFACIEKK